MYCVLVWMESYTLRQQLRIVTALLLLSCCHSLFPFTTFAHQEEEEEEVESS